MKIYVVFILGIIISALNVVFQISSHSSTINANLFTLKSFKIIKINAASQFFAPLGGLFLLPFLSISYALFKVKKKIIARMLFVEFLIGIASLIFIGVSAGLILYFGFNENIVIDTLIYLDRNFVNHNRAEITLNIIIASVIFLGALSVGIYLRFKSKSKRTLINKLVTKLNITPIEVNIKGEIKVKLILFSIFLGISIWVTESIVILFFIDGISLEIIFKTLFAISLSYIVGLMSLIPGGYLTRELVLYVLLGRYFLNIEEFLYAVGSLRGVKIFGNLVVGFISMSPAINKEKKVYIFLRRFFNVFK